MHVHSVSLPIDLFKHSVLIPFYCKFHQRKQVIIRFVELECIDLASIKGGFILFILAVAAA